MARLYAATGDAIARLDESGEAWTVELCLPGSGAQCLAVDPKDPDTVYAGLREGGVRRTVDAGRTWFDCALPEPGVFSLAVSAADGAVYAGTEPSRLFRSDDRGESWRELEALLELPSRPNWSFPPRPWTSHVRWIVHRPADDPRAARAEHVVEGTAGRHRPARRAGRCRSSTARRTPSSAAARRPRRGLRRAGRSGR